MLPLIPLVIPAIIGIAEVVFKGEKNGKNKKQFAMEYVEKFYDRQAANNSFITVIPKALFMDEVSLLIDHLVPSLTK